MRIDFSTDGGIANFPGLARPIEIDVDSLDENEAARLKRLVQDASFFDQPAFVGSPSKGSADYQVVVLTIDDGTRTHTVRVLEPAEDPALNDLVQSVRKHIKAIRAAQREGSSGTKSDE
jgi:hypothetical protein